MSLGLYDNERRYRRRRWMRFSKLLVSVAVLVVTAMFAYQMGVEQYRARDVAQQAEIQRLQRERETLEQTVLKLQGDVSEAEIRVQEWEKRYATDVPQGELRQLTRMISSKLAGGVTKERLSFLIETAANPRSCGQVETKRFIVLTPLYKGANSSISFADGRITVTGDGVSARNAGGAPEAWFDTAEPVTLRFTVIGGDQSKISGMLPLHHAVVIGDAEYRFTIRATEKDRGFVEVTAERCDYP